MNYIIMLIIINVILPILILVPNFSEAANFPVAKNKTVSTKENSEKTITLTGSIVTNGQLKMAITSGPLHGRLTNLTSINSTSSQVIYTPNKNYLGADNFKFISIGANSISKDAVVLLNIISAVTSGWLALFAFFLSFGIIFLITLTVNYFVGTKRKHKNIPQGKHIPIFWDITRDDDWYPSLAKFQFLLWTFIISFALLGVYFVRLFNGITEPPVVAPGNQFIIPDNLIILMGISVAVPIASSQISKLKYKISAPRDPPPDDSLPGFETILEENNKPTLTRYQMFVWTWIGIIIYLMILFSNTANMLGNVVKLGVPDISPVFVLLMGISNVGYIGGKIVSTFPPIIIRIIPKKDGPGKPATIIGTKFGTSTGNIWFEQHSASDPKQISVSKDDIKGWSDNAIEIKIPNGLTVNTEYDIIIRKDEFVTEPTENSTFVVTT